MTPLEFICGVVTGSVFFAYAVEALWQASNGEQVMEPGDTVTLASDATFRGTLVRLPRSVGRKRPRALVQSQLGEQWIPVDELRPVQSSSEQ